MVALTIVFGLLTLVLGIVAYGQFRSLRHATTISMNQVMEIGQLQKKVEKLAGQDDSEQWATLEQANDHHARTWFYLIFDNAAGHRFSVVYLIGYDVPYLGRLRQMAKPKREGAPKQIVLRHARPIFASGHDTTLEGSFIAGVAMASWAMGVAPERNRILPVIDDEEYKDLLDPKVRIEFRNRLAGSGTLFDYEGVARLTNTPTKQPAPPREERERRDVMLPGVLPAITKS